MVVRQSARGDSGVALILALFFSIVVTGLIVSGSMVLTANRKKTETSYRVFGQATQFARSGLTEALTWFRRQTSQPVAAFLPRIDLAAVPPITDTDDEELGIVREFEITANVWGRYEVWKQWDADPDPNRLLLRQQFQCQDVSSARLRRGVGSAWSIRSIGYVFRRVDPNAAFNQYPNHVLGRQTLETEIFRLYLAPPGQSAICINDGNNCHINTQGRIVGGGAGAGVFYPQGTGTPTTGPASANRVTGTPALSPTSSPYSDAPEDVFGMSLAELRSVSDIVVTDPDDFPDPVPDNSIVFCEVASISFDAARPLRGTGVVYIQGNTTIAPGSNSVFSGLLYVDGGFTMRDPSEIYGAVVVTGNMTVQGNPDYATIFYDDDILNTLRQEIGQYRMSGAVRPVRHKD